MSHPDDNGSVARRSDTWKGNFQRDAKKHGRLKMKDGGLVGYDDFHKNLDMEGLSESHRRILGDALFFDRMDDPDSSELNVPEYHPPRLPEIQKFAIGGSIGAPATVGLGTFQTQDQGGVQGNGMGNPYANNFGFGAGAPVGTQQRTQAAAPAAATPDPYNGRMPVGPGLTGTGWAFGDGGLTRQEGIDAPIYNDVFTSFLGQDYMTGYDPALAMTLNAGGAGGMQQGLAAFLPTIGNNDFQAVNRDLSGEARYSDDEMKRLAANMRIDTGGLSGLELQNKLNTDLKDYMMIGGMSAGWNPSGDIRQGNSTMYKRENGKLVPYQTYGYHAPEKGSWIQENPEILPVLAIATGGLAAGYFGAAGAAGAAGGGITGTGGASAAAAYGAGAGSGALGTAGTASLGAAGGLGAGYGTGALGAGITGAGASTVAGAGTGSGWLGNVLGNSSAGNAYASLPGWGQSAVQGAVQGAGTSGLTGGDPIRGALLGAAGGAGGYFGGSAGGSGFTGTVGKQLGSMGAKYFTSQALPAQQQRKP